MASLERLERSTRCLEVMQQAYFLPTLKLFYCFLPIPILATKPYFSPHFFKKISAKLVFEYELVFVA
jgi:hypothetical protein